MARKNGWQKMSADQQSRDWKKLKAGDSIRIVAVPEGDQWHYDTSGATFTIRVLRRLIQKKSVVRISHIDKETGYPWFSYRFETSAAKWSIIL